MISYLSLQGQGKYRQDNIRCINFAKADPELFVSWYWLLG